MNDDEWFALLHALRLLGHATVGQLTERLDATADEVEDRVLDAEARGLVAKSAFGDGWSLTSTGTVRDEALAAAELDRAGARLAVASELDAFGPVNHQVTAACTRWQLTELGLAQPPVPRAEVLADLADAADQLAAIEQRLSRHLRRFAGYHRRFAAALRHAETEPGWVTGIDRDSAHRVWFELHEDLLATLGRQR